MPSLAYWKRLGLSWGCLRAVLGAFWAVGEPSGRPHKRSSSDLRGLLARHWTIGRPKRSKYQHPSII
eukprot:4560695-Pyramimonas_sp.AAC.1